MSICDNDPPPVATDLIGAYLESAALLGRRTGDLHVALASGLDDREFQPEPFTPFDQRSTYQGMRALAGRVFPLLRARLASMRDGAHAAAAQAIEREPAVLKRFQALAGGAIGGMRIRCHGDLHLGQVLVTGSDFVITDFEGEPARPLSERRLKRPPLRDVAGMLRSFDYATSVALRNQIDIGEIEADQLGELTSWARLWQTWVSAAFLRGYMKVVQSMHILPGTGDDAQLLLDTLILEKTVYELGYELNNRPSWVDIPLQGILRQTESA